MEKRKWLLLFTLLIAMAGLFIVSEPGAQFSNNAPSGTTDPNSPLIDPNQSIPEIVHTIAGKCEVDRLLDLKELTRDMTTPTAGCDVTTDTVLIDTFPVDLFAKPQTRLTFDDGSGEPLYCWPSVNVGEVFCVQFVGTF